MFTCWLAAVHLHDKRARVCGGSSGSAGKGGSICGNLRGVAMLKPLGQVHESKVERARMQGGLVSPGPEVDQ